MYIFNIFKSWMAGKSINCFKLVVFKQPEVCSKNKKISVQQQKRQHRSHKTATFAVRRWCWLSTLNVVHEKAKLSETGNIHARQGRGLGCWRRAQLNVDWCPQQLLWLSASWRRKKVRYCLASGWPPSRSLSLIPMSFGRATAHTPEIVKN